MKIRYVILHSKTNTQQGVGGDSDVAWTTEMSRTFGDYYINFTGLGNYLPSQSQTTEFWIKSRSMQVGYGSAIYAIKAINNSTNRYSAHATWTDDVMYFDNGDLSGGAPGRIFKAAPAGFRNTWHHLALVVDTTSGMSLYLDGNLFHSVANFDTFNPNNVDFIIGAWTDVNAGVTTNYAPFAGELGELRIWNYARTQAEIQSTMNTAFNQPKPGLVTCWRLDDTVGVDGTIIDRSGNNYHGAVVPLGQIYRYNMGGSDFTDANGRLWTGFATPNSLDYGLVYPSTTGLYRDVLYGSNAFTIPVPEGCYQVTGYWQELFHDATGERVTSLQITNGATLISNVDGYRADHEPVIVSSTVDAIASSSNGLTLNLSDVVDLPIIAGLSFLKKQHPIDKYVLFTGGAAIIVPDLPVFTEFTASFWIKIDPASSFFGGNWQYVLDARNLFPNSYLTNNAYPPGMNLTIDGVTVQGTGNTPAKQHPAIVKDKWQYWVAVFPDIPAGVATTGSLLINARHTYGESANLINYSDIKIFNRALSGVELTNHRAVSDAGLLAHYDIKESEFEYYGPTDRLRLINRVNPATYPAQVFGFN